MKKIKKKRKKRRKETMDSEKAIVVCLLREWLREREVRLSCVGIALEEEEEEEEEEDILETTILSGMRARDGGMATGTRNVMKLGDELRLSGRVSEVTKIEKEGTEGRRKRKKKEGREIKKEINK